MDCYPYEKHILKEEMSKPAGLNPNSPPFIFPGLGKNDEHYVPLNPEEENYPNRPIQKVNQQETNKHLKNWLQWSKSEQNKFHGTPFQRAVRSANPEINANRNLEEFIAWSNSQKVVTKRRTRKGRKANNRRSKRN